MLKEIECGGVLVVGTPGTGARSRLSDLRNKLAEKEKDVRSCDN